MDTAVDESTGFLCDDVHRLGKPEYFPQRLAHNQDEVKELDSHPGWIGGTSSVDIGSDPRIRELGLGGEESLEGKRRYRRYVHGETSDV